MIELPLSEKQVSALLLCIDVSFDKWESNPDEFEDGIWNAPMKIDLSWPEMNYEDLMKTVQSLGGVE